MGWRLVCRQAAGDVGGAGLAVAAEGEVAQGGHDGWAVAGADLAVVFGEGHIAVQCSLFSIDQCSRMISASWSERMSPKPRSVTA